MTLVKIRAMARKEFIHIFRDFRSLYLAVIIPIVMIVLFGYALKLDVEKVQTAVLDQDQSVESRNLLSQLTASGYFVVVANARDADHLQQLIDAYRCHVGLVIPPDYSTRLRSGDRVPIQALVDGSNSNRASIIIGYLEAITRRYNAALLVESGRKLGIKGFALPIDHRLRIWFNEELESKNYILPGLIAVIMMIVGALMTSLIIAREWERGTMETLLSIPILPQEVVLGKIIPYFLIGMFDLVVSVLLTRWGFGIQMKGSLGLLFLSAAIFLYCALALGILISSATKSQLMANQLGFMLTFLPTFLLSGFIFPVEQMPAFIQKVTYIIPARYFIAIIRGIYLRGVGLEYLWQPLLAMLAFGLILTALAVKVSRQRIG
jgi:ABC-2 type transport system permease protein